MRITIERKVAQILQRLLPALSGNRLIPDITAQHLGHLDVEEMGRVERHLRRENTFFNSNSGWSLQKPFDGRRRVQDNHRASRSRRTASAADTGAVTLARRRKRSRSSAMVGRSARQRISVSR